MSYRYYDSAGEDSNKFEHGDVHVEVRSRKEKFEGMQVRKLTAKHAYLAYDQEVTHIQELRWADNCSPDHAGE